MITYLKGDATVPCKRPAIITHVCNDIGGWGRGFVLALSKRWKEPEEQYRSWYRNRPTPFVLGNIQVVTVDKDLYVANMIAQHDIREIKCIPPIRYEALETCLRKVNLEAEILNASIHMPRIGCGLAGGSWSRVETIITQVFNGVSVFVYDLVT